MQTKMLSKDPPDLLTTGILYYLMNYYYLKKIMQVNTFKFFKYEMSEIRVILLSERSKCSRWIFWDKESIVQIRFPESPSQVNSFRSFNPSIVDKQLWGRFNIFKWCNLATCSIRTSRLFCAES